MINQNHTLYEHVYDTLCSAIVKGEIKPGTHLAEVSLAKSLNTSRTPLRMAIRKLEDEGFVKKVRGRTIVNPITQNSVNEVFEFRALLENFIVEEVAKKISYSDIEDLKHANNEFEQAIRKEDLTSAIQADEKFHDIIHCMSGNPILSGILKQMEQSSYWYRVRALSGAIDCYAMVREHNEIIHSLVRCKNAWVC